MSQEGRFWILFANKMLMWKSAMKEEMQQDRCGKATTGLIGYGEKSGAMIGRQPSIRQCSKLSVMLRQHRTPLQIIRGGRWPTSHEPTADCLFKDGLHDFMKQWRSYFYDSKNAFRDSVVLSKSPTAPLPRLRDPLLLFLPPTCLARL